MSDIATLSASTPSSSTLISPFGAHLLSWRPTGDEDVLWLSSRAVMDGTRAIRGGIPLCLPWFGDPEDSPRPPGSGRQRARFRSHHHLGAAGLNAARRRRPGLVLF